MNLKLATLEYVALKQSMGMRFETEAALLRSFIKQMGDSVAVATVTSKDVFRYLNGRKAGPVTLFWHRKHDALKGFWEFAIRRGYTDRSPVPVHRAKEPVRFVPYIYSREELKRLLDGVTSYQKKWLKLEPVTLRAMLLLIYGAGLRISEALHLTCADVDLSGATLTIRESKFYKTRRIALNAQLCGVLSEYDHNRRQKELARTDAALFFTYKDGGAVARYVLEDAFLRLRTHVGVKRQNARYQPRLHDLRHTFAVHRLTAWYRTGADVQGLLPGLSTHLGHLCLKGTQRYLTMTPELLTEASLRFEGYAQGCFMDKRELLGPWLRRFLLEHVVHERNLSHNTQHSYRDTLTMLLPFVAERAETALDRLQVIDVSANRVRAFLTHLEQVRKVSISTRNQRLAAIHALARFIAEHSPQHVAWAGEVRTVPFKKTVRELACYLDKHEVEALLATPDRTTAHGQRNYALLLFLYNSGARASEAANLCIADLELDTRHPLTASVRILGKGGKVRRCPLWQKTALELEQLIKNRSPEQRVFLNRRREPLTRFGIHTLIRTCVVHAGKRMPSLLNKRISPHTLRQSTATHLLRAGVDLNTIRAWLGHVSLDTTQIYAEIDLEAKARALDKCQTPDSKRTTLESSGGLMHFLRTI